MDVRRFGRAVPLAALHAGPRHARTTRATTTSATRAPSGRRAGRCAPRPPTPGTPRTAPSSGRRPAGSGSTTTRRPGTEALRPRGWAGRNWSPCVEPEHGRSASRRASSTSRSFAKIEITGPDAASFCAHVFAGAGRPAARHRSSTPRRSTSAAASRLDVTVTRLGRPTRSCWSPAPRSASHDLGWLRRQARLTGADVRIADVTARLGVLRAVGPAGAGAAGPAHPGVAGRRDFPYLIGAGDHRRATCRCGRCASRTWGSWAGSCTAPPSTARRCGEALAATGATPGRVPGDREPAAGEGLPGLGLRHRPGDHPRRGRPAVRRAAAAAGSSGAAALAAARERAHPAPALPGPRRSAGRRAGR